MTWPRPQAPAEDLRTRRLTISRVIGIFLGLYGVLWGFIRVIQGRCRVLRRLTKHLEPTKRKMENLMQNKMEGFGVVLSRALSGGWVWGEVDHGGINKYEP